MTRTALAIITALLAGPAIAQTANELEGAYIACEGVRKSCSRSPAPAECTKERVDNCRLIEGAYQKAQEDRRAANHANSIEGIAERLRQQQK